MVYLLCFNQKLKHAKHYIGFCENPNQLDKRMTRHRSGQGAKLIAAIMKVGIDFAVVRTWLAGDRSFERKLKNRKNAKKLCPICSMKPTVLKPMLELDIETRPLNGHEAQVYTTIKILGDSYSNPFTKVKEGE